MKILQKGNKGPVTCLLLIWLCLQSPAAQAQQAERNLLASLEGLVFDSQTHQPVTEAWVGLVRGRIPAGLSVRSLEVRASTVTDKRGRFRFDAIEPGVYTLVATKRGYVPVSFYVLGLEGGKVTRRDVPLDPLAKVSGRVVAHTDHAIKGARVGVVVGLLRPSAALNWLLTEDGMSALTTTTDSLGKFELFVPAEEGKVTLLAGALGYASSRVEALQIEAGREQKGLVVQLPPGLEVPGRVVDARGMPVSGATIVARRSEPGREGLGFEDIEPRATSGTDGSFLLKGLEKGTYALRVSHLTHATWTVSKIEIESPTSQVPDIVLLPQAEIRGGVTDAAGQPVAGAIVSGGRPGEESSTMVLSDGDGKFAVGQFSSGESVVLFAEAPGYVRGEEIVTAPQTDVVLVVRSHGVLRGRVEESDTKGPVREFRIWVSPGSEEKSFRSEDGTFEWQGLPPGRWTFVAQAPGYQEAELRAVEIRSGEPTEGVVFLLRGGVELAGRVVNDETGEVLPDVTVAYRDASVPEDSAWLRFTKNKQTTDVEGNFKFEGVPPVEVTVIAYSPLYAEARTSVIAGEEDFLEIRLRKGASLSGRVVASDGVTPLPGAQVSLENVARRIGNGIRADGAGFFSFDRLSAGRYELKAESNYGQTQPLNIVLRENERLAGLTLVIKPGATLRGKVSGMMLGELPIVNLVANGRGGFTAFVSTDADGVYSVHGVPAGVVQVMASTSSFRIVRKSIEVPEAVQELTLDIEFSPAARLYGQVTRAGRPVPFAEVSAVPADPQLVRASGRTDQDGRYAINGLSDGEYIVHLSGGERRSIRILGDTNLDIELSALSVSGRVLEVGSQEPLPQTNVQVRAVAISSNVSSVRTTVTDAQGRFLLEGIKAGDHQLIAYRPNFRIHAETVPIPSSTQELTVFLTPAEGIEIRVRDGISGLGLRTVSVNVISGPVRLSTEVALDDTGRGTLPQLPTGRYNMLVSAWGYAAKSLIGWSVPSSPVDISLTPGGRLEIQVNSNYSGVRASLLNPNGVPPRPTNNPFTLSQPTVFSHLEPGEYTLFVGVPNTTKTYRVTILEEQTTMLRVE